MKLSKHVLPVLAVLVVISVIAPFSQAAVTKNTTIFDLESTHADQYDETVNIANESSATNHQTWTPEPKGAFVGSATPESHFQLQTMATNNTDLRLTWESTISSEQIMSGASQFVLRTPIHVTDTLGECGLSIYSIQENETYEVTSGTNIEWGSDAEPFEIFSRSDMYPSDTNITDGNDVWVKDSRMYVKIMTPILPDRPYLFVFDADYTGEGEMELWLAPNDVCNDGITRSNIAYTVPTSPDTEEVSYHEIELDLGYSFDFRQGLGNGVTARSFYLYPGDIIQFTATAPGQGELDGYHTLMIPFQTGNGSAAFEVTVADDSNIFVANRTYDGYILESSDSTYNASDPDRYRYTVRLESQWPQRVQLYFEDQPYSTPNKGEVNTNNTRHTYVGLENFERPDGSEYWKEIGFQVLSRYQVCANQSTHLDIGAVMPDKGIQWDWWEFAKWVFPTAHFVDFVIGDEEDSNYERITRGVSILTGPGLAGGMFAEWIANTLDESGILDDLQGKMRNALDNAWGALSGFGSFLWSVGEYIYDALTWFADMITEYGAYLLGLTIVGVALLLFFFPLWFELKLLEYFRALAQGDPKKAQATGQQIVGTLNKIRGR